MRFQQILVTTRSGPLDRNWRGREDVPWEGDDNVGRSDQDWARWLSQPNTQQSTSGWTVRERGSLAVPDRQNTLLRGQAMLFTPSAPT
eukprot:1113000-Pyramimonas_sp.AAC.1